MTAPSEIAPIDDLPDFPETPLLLADRCDRCGAQAFLRVSVLNQEGSPTDLLFCAHHFQSFEDIIRGIALHVYDGRDNINKKPSASSA